jgi:hypothetical protein
MGFFRQIAYTSWTRHLSLDFIFPLVVLHIALASMVRRCPGMRFSWAVACFPGSICQYWRLLSIPLRNCSPVCTTQQHTHLAQCDPCCSSTKPYRARMASAHYFPDSIQLQDMNPKHPCSEGPMILPPAVNSSPCLLVVECMLN